jgi:hypothetical protein
MSESRSMIKLDGSEGALRLDDLLRNNNCMIRFHMYGCMWCDKMKPEWHKLADRLSKSNRDIMVLDVDSEAVRSSTNPVTKSVNGFPTIVYSPKGEGSKTYKFEDELGRTAENMEKWLKSISKEQGSLVSSLPTSVSMSKSYKTKKSKTAKRKKISKLGGSRRVRRRTNKTRRHKRRTAKH